MNFTAVQLIIVDTIVSTGGCSWKDIKDAIIAHGYEPIDWLTQVRGPLQNLIDEKKVRRLPDTEHECYVLAETRE